MADPKLTAEEFLPGSDERFILAGKAMRRLMRLTEHKRDRPSLHYIGIFGLLAADKILEKRNRKVMR